MLRLSGGKVEEQSDATGWAKASELSNLFVATYFY